jgi:hypothetical protein
MQSRDIHGPVPSLSAPVPIVLTAALAFALFCVGLAAMVVGPICTIITAVGAVVAAGALIWACYVVVYKPGVLRIECVSATKQTINRA